MVFGLKTSIFSKNYSSGHEKRIWKPQEAPAAAKKEFGSRKKFQRPRKPDLEAARSSCGLINRIIKPQPYTYITPPEFANF